ncbi:putative SMC N superfamily protein, partial [Candidatus Termititenax persephonae]
EEHNDMLGAYIHYQNAAAWLDLDHPDGIAKYLNLSYIESRFGPFNDNEEKAAWEKTIDNLRKKFEQDFASYLGSEGGVAVRLQEAGSRIKRIRTDLEAKDKIADKLTILQNNQKYLELYYQLEKNTVPFWQEEIIAKATTLQDFLDMAQSPAFRTQSHEYLDTLPAIFAEQALQLLSQPQNRATTAELRKFQDILTAAYNTRDEQNRWLPKTLDPNHPVYRLLASLREWTPSPRQTRDAVQPTASPKIVKTEKSVGETVTMQSGGKATTEYENVEISDLHNQGNPYIITNPEGLANDTANYNNLNEAANNAQDAYDNAVTTQLEPALEEVEAKGQDVEAKGEIVAEKEQDVAEKEEIVAEKEQIVADLEESTEAATARVEETAERVGEVEARVEETTGRVEDAEARVEETELDVGEKEGIVIDEENNVAVMEDDYNDGIITLPELENAQSILENANIDWEAAKQVFNNAQNNLATARDALIAANAALTSAQGNLPAAQNALANAQTALAAAQEALLAARDALAAAQTALTNAQGDLQAAQTALQTAQEALLAIEGQCNTLKQAWLDAQGAFLAAAPPDLINYATLLTDLNGELFKDIYIHNANGQLIKLMDIIAGAQILDTSGKIMGFLYDGVFWYITDEGKLVDTSDSDTYKITFNDDGTLTIEFIGDAAQLIDGGKEIGYIGTTNIMAGITKVTSIDKNNDGTGVLHFANVTEAFFGIPELNPDGTPVLDSDGKPKIRK